MWGWFAAPEESTAELHMFIYSSTHEKGDPAMLPAKQVTILTAPL